MANVVTVAQVSEIEAGKSKCIEVNGKKIAVFNENGHYYAMDDRCSHAGGPLSDGDVSDGEVSCPWHGAIFELKTGKVRGGPAQKDLNIYPVKIEGNQIQIEIG